MSVPGPIPLRVVLAPCRSSTTALLRLFAQHPDVHCVYQPVKSGLRTTGAPDHGIYRDRHPVFEQRPRFVVSKETVGHSSAAECSFDPFGSDAVIRRVRPLFVLREPARTWSSWKRLGWGTLDLFVTAYRRVYDLMVHARSISPHVLAVTAESLSANKRVVLQEVCAAWDLSFDPALLADFDTPLFENRRFHMDDAARRYSRAKASHEVLMRSTGFGLPAAQEDLTSPEERQRIRQALDPLYAAVREADSPASPATGVRAQWIMETHTAAR